MEEVVLVEKRPEIFINMVSGGIAGTFADVILHPVDTLKTRMQGQLTSKSTKYNGMSHDLYRRKSRL